MHREPRPGPGVRAGPSVEEAADELSDRGRGAGGHDLDDDQLAALRAQLGARVGRDIRLDTRVDPNILGGLVVRLGSQMIDASIRTKLNTLATAMKG